MTEHVRAAEPEAIASFKDVKIEIGEKTLLSIDKIAFPSGRVSGLIGQNGSGKSTLLKVLANQMPTVTGEVTCLGKALHQWDRKELARSIAYLPQDPPPTRGMLVRELVALGRYPWHGAFGRFSEKDAQKTQASLELTNISHLSDRLVDTLSGGERQRAWIAMMMAQDAKCLLMDEPISALDIAHQVEVLDLVRNLSIKRGLSVIIVLHDINMAARYCDRIVALKQGQIIADATPDDLLQSPLLQQVFGIPISVVPHPGGQGVLTYVD
ncbi:MAG: ATP-binding cassette domain-containing protein [Cohaesibacter sp.]|nr:ATP-binding cassette domain-containing protein [Cohaesibacter sp.]MCV6603204.1 ATP-binding cassette domain-containing protein [Cohaesibacter sp.]